MMKVWTTCDLLLQEQFKMTDKLIPAGTCLMVSDRQCARPPKALVVYGAGIYDMVSMDDLTLEPQSIYA